MRERPKIKLELTTLDKTLELLGWVSILAIWVLPITNYTNLSDRIPIHYNAAGQADGFGGKRKHYNPAVNGDSSFCWTEPTEQISTRF